MTPSHPTDSVVISLTAPGAAAIAVVRISGPQVLPFLQVHFSKQTKPLRAVHGELRDGDTLLDDPVVMLAEDQSWADLNLHGGPWVVEAVLRLAERAGFSRIAPMLPLHDSAVDGSTIIEREIERYLPLARTELAIRTLLAQRDAWERLERNPPDAAEAERILADRAMEHLLHPPTVAIIGIPNCGKSTLANQLFAQERTITADLPGTTRDWVGEIANIDGLAVKLVDTPGIRVTDDPIEHTAIQRSGVVIAGASLVLLVLDPTQDRQPQQALVDQYPAATPILNKSDRPGKWAAAAKVMRLCALSGDGIDQVRAEILKQFNCHHIDDHQPRAWTNRQREWLSQRR